MRRLLLILALSLLVMPCMAAVSCLSTSAGCSSAGVCPGGASGGTGTLTGFSNISCSCGIQWDTAQPGVINPAGGDLRCYDAFWLTSPGLANRNREAVWLTAGGYNGLTQNNYLSAANISDIVQGDNSNRGAPTNFYVGNYTKALLINLTSTISSGSTTMAVNGSVGGCAWWPTGTGAGGSFPITLDDTAVQESLSVTALSGSCSSASWTLASGPAANHTITANTLTVAANASGGQTVYTGTFAGGASNALAGQVFIVAGFGTAANNGTYLCTGSSLTTLTLNNAYGVSETHAGTATNRIYGWATNVQYPTPVNDVASFFSFLAHCSYGGTSYNSGSCAGFTNVPGNPQQIMLMNDSAGGLYELVALQGGCNKGSTCTFLDNNPAHAGHGYTVWTDTNWTVQNPYGSYTELGRSSAIDPAALYAKTAVNGNPGGAGQNSRLADSDGTGTISVCGCVPNCDNGNPSSWNSTTQLCSSNPSTCYTACAQNWGTYYRSAVQSTPIPVPSWVCDGVGTGSCIAGVPTLTGSFDGIFGIEDCIIGTQTNMTAVGYPGGHTCGGTSFTDMVTLMGGDVIWTSTDLPKGTNGSAYNQTLSVTGGSGTYTFSITAGALTTFVGGGATGLSLNTSTGAITGTPGASGYIDFTVHVVDSGSLAASPDREFTIGIFPVLDTYGGVSSQPIPACTPAYWQLSKSSGRWLWASPTNCNANWHTDIQDAATSWLNGTGSARWSYTNSASHALDWGFNTFGVFSDTQYQDGTSGTNTEFVLLMRTNLYAVDFSGFCSGTHVILKQFSQVSPTWVVGTSVLSHISFWPDPTNSTSNGAVDVADPEWASCATTAATATYSAFAGIATNHRKRGILLDEIDGYFGKAFESPYPDPAYLALVGQNCASGGTANGVCGSGNPLWIKYALTTGVSGIDFGFGVGKGFLNTRYSTIGLLNTAWGTTYTTFGSAGGWTVGGTTSTGMLDENGVLTVGVGGASDPSTLTTVSNATARADLKDFDYWYSYFIYHPQVVAIQAQDSNNPVIFSMSYYGANGTAPHACGVGPLNNFILGFRDAIVNASAQGIIMGCHDPKTSGSGSETVNKAIYDATCSGTLSPGGVGPHCTPIESWIATSSNPDSDEVGHSVSYSDYVTQTLRGAAFAGMVRDIWNAQGTNGDYYSPGYQMWALFDSSSEHINFGAYTYSADPYNGNASTIPTGTDYNSTAQGGETANYGATGAPYIGQVTQANLGIFKNIQGLTLTNNQVQVTGSVQVTGKVTF